MADIFGCLSKHLAAQVGNAPLPNFTWTRPDENTLTVSTTNNPVSVKLWQAVNSNNRDFRLETIGPAWTSTELTDKGGGVYTGTVQEPQAGYRAFMIQLEFDSSGYGENYVFSTEVCVVPDYLPYAADFDFDGDIDPVDLSILSTFWLSEAMLADIMPIDGDGFVNMFDFSLLAKNWKP